MREIINISLPSTMAKTVKKAVRDGDYISTSEFFRGLVRDWQTEQVARELKASQTEIASGKGKVLRSLKSLR